MNKLITRRSLLVGSVTSLICAPAIVRAASIMPVKAIPDVGTIKFDGSVWRLESIQQYVFRLTENDAGGFTGEFVGLAA